MRTPENRTARAQLTTATPGLPPLHRRFHLILPDPAATRLEILSAARDAVEIGRIIALTNSPHLRRIVRYAGSHGLWAHEIADALQLEESLVQTMLDPFEEAS